MIPKELLIYLAGIPTTSTFLAVTRQYKPECRLYDTDIMCYSLGWPVVMPIMFVVALSTAPISFIDYCKKKV